MTVAIGYVKIDGDRIEKSPDMRVQKVIALVFDTFAELKSIRQVLVWLRHEQIRLPVIPGGRAEKPVEWRLPVYSTLWHMLKNPVYTGAFAYGRRAVRVTIDNGRERLSRRIQASSTGWEVLIPGHHDGYVSAKSWSRVERIIARVEVGDRGADTRFVVTSLKKARAAGFTNRSIVGAAKPKTTSNVENPPRRRSHIMHQGHRQSVAAVPPCKCLLAHVGPAHRHAETLDVAHRPVRYLAPAAHQDRSPRHRIEDPDPCPMADRLRLSAGIPDRPRSHPASCHLTVAATR